jgi:hypothetical protein
MARNKRNGKGKGSTIYTTIFDLVRAVNQLTSDDSLVVAAVSDLVNSYRTTMGHMSAPVKVVPAFDPSGNGRNCRRIEDRRRSGCHWSAL